MPIVNFNSQTFIATFKKDEASLNMLFHKKRRVKFEIMIELRNVRTYRAQMLAYHADIEAERKVF